MQMMNNPYSQYNKNKIMTASKAELTLMLYEGAIKFCNKAITAIENKDVQQAHDSILKVERIIQEFQITLDHKFEVSKEFDKVYDYIQWRLKQANAKKDTEILEEVLAHLRTLRDTWKEVMRLAKSPQ